MAEVLPRGGAGGGRLGICGNDGERPGLPSTLSCIMSSAWPPQQRSWWSRSKSNDTSPNNSNGSLRQNRSFSSLIQDEPHANKIRPTPAKRTISTSSKKLTSIASAIGLKSKRQELAIQDPPGPLRAHHAHPPAIVTAPIREQQRPVKLGRPPARSVSSVATEAEPRTPSDLDRGRSSYQSVMTLSETDPFAASVISVPSTPQDPGRLSAYSDKSNWDPRFKKLAQERMSYASGSSVTSYTTGESSGSGTKSPRYVSQSHLNWHGPHASPVSQVGQTR